MKTLKTIMFLCVFYTCGYNGVEAQIEFIEDSVIISELFHICPSNMVFEDFGEGPYVSVFFKIKNTSSDTIILNGDEVKVCFVFLSKGKERKVRTASTMYCPSDTILPQGSCSIRADASLYLHPPITTLLNYNVADFTPMIKEVGKTISVEIDIAGKRWIIPLKKIKISDNYIIDFSLFMLKE